MKRDLPYSKLLKNEREKRAWKLKDVAERIGCDHKTVARWENGESFPRLHHRQKIRDLFGKTLEELGLVPTSADDATVFVHVSNQPSLAPHIPDPKNIIASTSLVIEETTNIPLITAHPQTYLNIHGLAPLVDSRVIQPREHLVKAVYTKLIQPDATAVVITGIAGVGKSTLAALIYYYVLERYQAGTEVFTAVPIWLTISKHVTMADLMGTLFGILGKPLPSLGNLTPQNQVLQLFYTLNAEAQTRLIVLDQFENVLDWQTGYALVECPGVGEWLDAINSQPCSCKMLLTSRIWPKGTRIYSPAYMQEYPVGGFDVTEGIELLRKRGVKRKQATDIQIRKAVTHCSGHAMALTLLASLLSENRGLSLSLLFYDPFYKTLWQGNMARAVLDLIYLKQLSELQRKLLSAFAIYRVAVPLSAAMALIDLHMNEETQVPFAFHSLLLHSLLQVAGEDLYYLHAIVFDYLQMLHNNANVGENNMLAAHYRAAQYYLRQAAYCPPLEQRQSVSDVQPFIEATWHLCQAERWQEACIVIYREELYQILRRLGENTTLLELYQQLQPSEKWHPELTQEAEIYDHLGRMYALIDKKDLALHNYRRALQVYELIGNCPGKGRTLHHLGLLYESLGQDMDAKESHEQALAIARETGDSKGEADSLNGLGWIYHRLTQHEKALHFCKEALDIHQARGNRMGESDTLNALGLIYYKHENVVQALECYTQSLLIRREMGNREKEGKTLNHLGLVYVNLGRIDEAQKCYKQSLIIRQEVGDRSGEGAVLYNLSKIFFQRQQYDVTLACLLLAGKISKGIRSSEYEATQRWIEILQKTVGKNTFMSMKKTVEVDASKIIERALNGNDSRTQKDKK